MKIRPMTVKELAAEYRVSRATMHRWLKAHAKEIGERHPGMQSYTVGQVETIYRLLDVPEREMEF